MTIASLAADEWQLPDFETKIYSPKSHSYVLIIPVINEGTRIQDQLRRLANCGHPIDIVIADGGSTDESLAPHFIQTTPVRAVLTKTGQGKLSAQLRMAYGWALQEGYAGIVTIDGNGKDGVDAVADMIAKLDDGYDYVQGSRYLPGGVAENTPFERTVGNRLIHAPMLSFAGRYRFKDTTNGFRAYSAKYLLDPRVKPFRHEFKNYELLFYLTTRAGQIGLKVGQVPVERRYPLNEKVPTKINGRRAKLQLLGQAVSAATGGYVPDEAARLRWPRIAFIFTLAIIVAWFLTYLGKPRYSPDSWAYFELSRTFFADFYQFSHFRTFWSDSAFSSSFPPLFPALIAGFDGLSGVGARSGYIVAFLAFIAFAFLSERIARRYLGVPLVGYAAALALLIDSRMIRSELLGGRGIPLQLVIFAIVLIALIHVHRLKIGTAFLLGLIAGLAILNRFDAVFFPPLLALLVLFLTRRPSLAISLLIGACVAALPWVWYSWVHFGVPFVSDNTNVARSTELTAFVTDWWPIAQPTLNDDFGGWIAKLITNAVGLLGAVLELLSNQMSGTVLYSFAILALLIWLVHIARDSVEAPSSTVVPSHRQVVAFFCVMMLLLLVPQILTGYFDARYFSASAWVLILLVGTGLAAKGQSKQQRMFYGSFLFAVIALVNLSNVLDAAHRSVKSNGILNAALWQEFDAPQLGLQLELCLSGQTEDRVLVLGNDTLAARLGAQNGLRTLMEPRNMSSGRLGADGSRAFVREWNVRYVFLANDARAHFATSTFDLSLVADCQVNLFRVAH